MIPKTIHYCWFGHNPKPKLAEKCIQSWKRHCPDYQIIEWNEDNFDISACPLYVRQAYEAKKWAFVTDYVRLKVVYEHGGIYLDTDVEIIKSLDWLLEYDAFFGFENGVHVATGLGFGAYKDHPIVQGMMRDYEGIPFVQEDGSFDSLPCPQRNTNMLLQYGLKQNNSRQIIHENVLILPSEYMCPISYSTGRKRITRNTISIHWFSSSWKTEKEKREHILKVFKRNTDIIIDYTIHIPNRFLRALLGEERYEKLKSRIKER